MLESDKLHHQWGAREDVQVRTLFRIPKGAWNSPTQFPRLGGLYRLLYLHSVLY